MLFPYVAGPDVERAVRPSTTGLASGNTCAEAIVSALCEVIERDAASRFLAGKSCPQVDLSSVTSQPERQLLELYEKVGVDVLAIELLSGSPAYAYFVLVRGEVSWGPPILAAGQGAGTDSSLALRRALLESAQSRVVAMQGSREDLIRHASDYETDTGALEERWQRVQQATRAAGLVEHQANTNAGTTTEGELRQLMSGLRSCGAEAIHVTDLTNEVSRFPVVHVGVPGLVDWVVNPEQAHA